MGRRFSDEQVRKKIMFVEKLMAEKPDGVNMNLHLKQNGISPTRANFWKNVNNGKIDLEKVRVQANKRHQDRRSAVPPWVRHNIYHADPQITMDVIKFLITRSVKTLKLYPAETTSDYFDDLMTMINNVKISHELKLKSGGMK
jgi:hypothetical protein